MKKAGKRNKLSRRSWDATAHEFDICFTSVGESQDWNWEVWWGYLEDHPRTCKWFIPMVSFSPLRIGLFPFQMPQWLVNGSYKQLTDWDDPPSKGTKWWSRSNSGKLNLFSHWLQRPLSKEGQLLFGWLQAFMLFSPIFWENAQFDSYFSRGGSNHL